MVTIDKDTKCVITLLTEEDILDFVEKKCGEDIKEYFAKELEHLRDEIKEHEGTIDSLEDELSICYEKMNGEDEE